MLRSIATVPLAFVAQAQVGGLVTRTGHAQDSAAKLFNPPARSSFLSPPQYAEHPKHRRTSHPAASRYRSLSAFLLAEFGTSPARRKVIPSLIGHRMPIHKDIVQGQGLNASRRSSMGAIALAALACNFVQCRSSSVALAASSDGGRLAGQGEKVVVNYVQSLEDGTIVESSKDKELIVGGGQIVKGFDDAVRGMRLGEKKRFVLPPDQAYGERNENFVFFVPKGDLPAKVQKGSRVGIGNGMFAVVSAIDGVEVELDANPPLAGKTVVFDVELSAFRNPPLIGVDMVGWHGKQFRVPFARESSPASKVFESPKWPAAWPYKPADFRRQDETTDNTFYAEPRFVTHIDNGFIGAIKSFYDLQFSQAPQDEYSVLDICSSWISHYPEKLRAKRVAITGMSEPELKANKQATEYVAKDLNVEPKFPYGDSEFDFVTNVVSVDYLNKPREIFGEMHRVLKPGGVAIMSFSNRCFATKAISMWVANMNDGPGHCQIIGNYFHFSPERGWKDISSVDISPNPGSSDPVWVVTAVKA